MPNLSEVGNEYPNATDSIELLAVSYRGGFVRFATSYTLDVEALQNLRKFQSDYVIFVTYADWCGDARRAVPVLSLLENETEFQIRAASGMTKPPYGSDELWAIPPSPQEVKTFEVTSSPTIMIFKKDTGEEIGRIKTKPKMTSKIETEILKIIEDSLA
ncbi:MAG: TlpA family protein disulfide reductase [Promethearchaeota archaeon]